MQLDRKTAAYLLLSFLILAVAMYLRIAPLAAESFEGDELFSRRVALADARQGWDMVRQDLVHPPLYYFLLKGTIPAVDSVSPYGIRALSLAAAAGTIITILAIGLVTPALRIAALLAALLLALNKVHIFYSQQARSYAFYCFLVGLLLFWRVLAERYGARWGFWVSGSCLMSAIVWTHYVGALFCAACVCSMLVLPAPNWKARALPLASLSIAGLSFLPWFIPEIAVYRERAGLSVNLDWQGIPPLQNLKILFANYIGIPNFRGAVTVAFLVGAVLAGCAFLPVRGKENALDARLRNALGFIAIGPPVFLWLTTRWPLHLTLFGERHVLPAIIPALLLICFGLTRIAGPFGVFVLGAVVLCAFQIAPVYRDWPGPQRQPYAAIARDLDHTNLDLPAYTTWFYGIGETVNFYSHGSRKIEELPPAAQLPARFLLLYRPDEPREVKVVDPLLQRYSIASENYYSPPGSREFGTRVLLLTKR